MRKHTELSANLRAMARSPKGWLDKIHDGTLQGGGGEMIQNALAVLAVAESRFMFLLVKTSGCRPEGEHDEHQASSAVVPGSHPPA